MPTYGITAAGFVPKRLADIKLEIEADFRAAYGPGVNLDPRTPEGQIIGAQSEREALVWEMAEQVYNSRYPDTAQGAALDNVAAVTGIQRLPATYSLVTVAIAGSDGTAVSTSFVVSVDGNKTARFSPIAGGTIAGGTLTLACRAESAGSVQAPSGTLTVIETPISGVTSVTNALDAVVGRDVETDAQLRLRRLRMLARAGTATVNGIVNALLEIPEVTQARAIENETDAVDIGNRPPHSFEAMVTGGADADVAQAIFSAKGAGIQTYGSTTVSVLDSQGLTHDVSFSRPTPVTVYLEVTIARNFDPNEGDVYPDNGDDAVKDAIIAYTGATGVLGREVVLSQLSTPINTVPGVFGISIRVSVNGSSWQSTNLLMAASEVAAFDTSRITVLHA